MNCRLGVTRHLKGGSQSFDPAMKELIIVWDAEAEGYRSIPIDGLIAVCIDGKREEIV